MCAALRTFYDAGQQMRVILTNVVITLFPSNGFDLLHLVKILFGNKRLMGNNLTQNILILLKNRNGYTLNGTGSKKKQSK